MSYQNINQFDPRNLFPILSLETYDMSLTSDELGFNQEVVFSPYLIAQTYGNKLPFYFDINNPETAQNLTLTYKDYNRNNIFVSQNYYNPDNLDLSCFSSSAILSAASLSFFAFNASPPPQLAKIMDIKSTAPEIVNNFFILFVLNCLYSFDLVIFNLLNIQA